MLLVVNMLYKLSQFSGQLFEISEQFDVFERNGTPDEITLACVKEIKLKQRPSSLS
jgi:hypothetical protein